MKPIAKPNLAKLRFGRDTHVPLGLLMNEEKNN
jgi:hypothetical protein